MTNQETKQQYEGEILDRFIKNSDRLAVVENDIAQIKQEVSSVNKTLSNAKNWLIAIFVGTIVNIFSQSILGFFN